MSEHICTRCKKNFKYLSYLQRHLECKKICSIVDVNITKEIKDTKDVKNNIIDNIKKTDNEDDNAINNIVKLHRELLSKSGTMSNENYKLTIDSINILLNKIDNVKKDNNINIDSNNNETISKNICNDCNIKFSSRQGLHRHKKTGKCKVINNIKPDVVNDVKDDSKPPSLTFDSIINSSLLVDNSINNIVNNTHNTDITINLNAFGCESLEHISLDQFKKIYKSIHGIDSVLCHFIYNRNPKNICFYKNNINQDIVSVINNKMEIEKMTDEQFIIELKKNINDCKIELFSIFKDVLSRDDIIKYMKNMIMYHNNLMTNANAKQQIVDKIRMLLDTACRDKDNKVSLQNIIKKLKTHSDRKKVLAENNKKIIIDKEKRIREYKVQQAEYINDDKNLYTLYNEAKNNILNEERIRRDNQETELENIMNNN